jgi:hypothetical protein
VSQPKGKPYRPRAPRATAATPVHTANFNREVATDFLAVPYAPAFTQYDSGQVVRVHLPRSSLGTFGLPFDENRAAERIKADVLLGEDGIARAVRFVR